MVVASGSITKRSIRDFAHLAVWALGAGAPVPLHYDTLDEWSFALDGGTTFANRIEPGALLKWADGATTDAARKGFQTRLGETPGCLVYHVSQDTIGADIQITGHVAETPDNMREAWRGLRDAWTLPDGQECVDVVEIYRHAQELALEFYYKWRVPGPEPWMQARKAWGKFAREKLKTGRWDSPDEVAKAFPGAPELTAWREIRDTFEPDTCIVWLGLGALNYAAEWLKGGGVVFVQHVLFGQALAYLAKVPFFAAQGLDANGQSIEHFQGRACIASAGSNTEGRNLQRFCRMLDMTPVPNNLQAEQKIGRLHREGQESDTVEVCLYLGCRENVSNFWQSVQDARTDTIHNEHKLLIASHDVPALDALPHTKAFELS